jgi:hypothetical protein
MDWWWNLVAAMDAHEGQAAWAQFAGAIIALLVALGLGLTQYLHSVRDQRERVAAYMAAAHGAAIHAELALIETEASLGGKIERSQTQVIMSPARFNLKSAELALEAVPLHLAPSIRVVQGLLGSLRAIRQARGYVDEFLRLDSHFLMHSTFEAEVGEAKKARKLIEQEEIRLVGRNSLGAAPAAQSRPVTPA